MVDLDYISMKMRLEKIALLSLVVLPSQIQSLVSCSLQVSRHQFSRSQFVLFQHSDDPSSDWGDEATEDDEVMDATNYLVSPSIEPGSLSAEEMADFFPLMLWWADGTMHSHENAATIEKLLNRFEKEIEAGKPAPKALVKYYVVAVDAWGKAGFPDKAKEIVSRMEALDLVNRVAYNAMMNAYVKLGDTENAAKILDMMEKTPSLAPTVLDYNTLLAGYAKRGHARQAEDLVKRMIDMCRGEDKRGLTPDLYSYNTLLDALAKSDEPGRGDRAHGILTTLLRKHESGELEWAPDERSFSAVISALARDGRSIEKIEKLWSEALVRGFGSDKYIHTALLDAIAKSDLSGSAEKASEILEKLEHEGLASDVAYNMVLKACKAEGTDKALQQAEKLFEKMSISGAADRFSYCTLIAMHADRGNIKSAERAEKLLVEMGNAMLVPNVETLNAGELVLVLLRSSAYQLD
jgi:pentatricopeptide repeat protein